MVVRLRASGKHVKEGQKIYIHEFCDHVTLNNPMTFNVMTQKCTKPSKDILCCYHGNNDSTHTKNKWLLHNTITYLYAKFEVNPRRNAAIRAFTRQSLFPQKPWLPWQQWLHPHQKQNRLLHYTMINLHSKYQVDLRNVASRHQWKSGYQIVDRHWKSGYQKVGSSIKTKVTMATMTPPTSKMK